MPACVWVAPNRFGGRASYRCDASTCTKIKRRSAPRTGHPRRERAAISQMGFQFLGSAEAVTVSGNGATRSDLQARYRLFNRVFR
jgi:hypothetical protein